MKIETKPNAKTLFSEQVSKVIDLFQEWNDCERSVSLYAVLKRLPFSCTKFIQSVIETNLQQTNCLLEQTNKCYERNANSAAFIQQLIETYKNIKCNDVQLNKDSIFYESDRRSSVDTATDKYYEKKEDILNDILHLMPILTPGNDEAKQAYIEIIPLTVEDAIRGVVNTSLVQQIFSYLLIHPAFTTDDRRSLSKFLRHLEEHILSTDPNFSIYPNGPSPTTSEPNTKSTTPTSNWQAIAPPSQSKSTETIISSWDSTHHLTQAFVDEKRQSSLGSIIDFKPVPGASPKLGHLYESGTDDHHISFSKNGTEILDFDCDDTDKSNTQIGFDTLANLNEFLTVPGLMENITSTLKTRRSNSLTTTGTIHTNGASASSSLSTQNLSNICQQKPRSFSLSMVSPRSSLTSSGSDTRLDDFKPNNYTKFSTHNVGMSNIGQWLKSLRLHKYVWLFSNITYEQMLDISEEYLQQLNVTKGARHKLVICIQKLKERYGLLCQIEKDLLSGVIAMTGVLDEMTNIVLTPMKPVEPFNKQDVGGQFLKVLNLVSTMMTTKLIVAQDEELVNSLLWILDKAVHTEAFVAHTNQLKEHRFKVSRIKVQFPPKGHYATKNGTNGGGNGVGPSAGATPPTCPSTTTGGGSTPSTSSNGNLTRTSLQNPLLQNRKSLQKLSISPTIISPTNQYKSPSAEQLPIIRAWKSNQELTVDNVFASSNSVEFQLAPGYERVNKMVENLNPKIEFASLNNIFQAEPSFFEKPKFLSQNFGSQGSLVSSSSSSGVSSAGSTLSLDSLSQPTVNTYAQITVCNIGMSNVGQWLKSLRLHKYSWVFASITYSQMMEISEEHLIRLNITQGARNKLILSIQKLHYRVQLLNELHADLIVDKSAIKDVLNELGEIVLTPMKPIQMNGDEDVGAAFLKVLHVVFTKMFAIKHIETQTVNKFVWILEKAGQSEAFWSHAEHLRQMRDEYLERK